MASLSIVDYLTNTLDEEAFGNAWAQFFLNEQLVTEVLQAPQETISMVLQQGHGWIGRGSDTTKAAKAIRSLTGVAMVSGKLQDYLNAFLYSLALCSRIEIPVLDLVDKAAEAAFRLADRWGDVSLTELVKGSAEDRAEAPV